MDSREQSIKFHELLPAFLREAEKLGFVCDARQWAALHQILENTHDLERLKFLMAPVFCKNFEEQERFYLLFDGWFGLKSEIGDDLEFQFSEKTKTAEPSKNAEQRAALPAEEDREIDKSAVAIFMLMLFSIALMIAVELKLSLSENVFAILGTIAAILIITTAQGLWKYLKVRFRQKLAVRQEKTNQTNTFWDFRLPHRQIAFGPDFKRLTVRLRERVPGKTHRLDLPKTIRKYARSGEVLEPVFRLGTEQPAYLILIDLSNDNNHRATLFDAFFRFLKDGEVSVARFFYRSTPRKLWNEEHPGGISLDALAEKFADSRLFLMGDGWRLLDPETGQPDEQAQVFLSWRERVLITPIPFPQWSGRERGLESLFLVAPFTVEGLGLIERHLNPEEPFDWENQRPEGWREEALLFDESDLPDSLRPHLPDPALLEWLAALSFYPELNWNLTLFLGNLLSEMHGRMLLTFENLRQLSRISWFYNGSIPAPAREKLYRLLDPEKAQRIHSEISRLLEAQLKEKEKFVSREQNRVYLQILLHKAHAGEASRTEIKELRRLAKDERQDFLMARFTDSPLPWEWVLPEGFGFLAEAGEGILGVWRWFLERVRDFFATIISTFGRMVENPNSVRMLVVLTGKRAHRDNRVIFEYGEKDKDEYGKEHVEHDDKNIGLETFEEAKLPEEKLRVIVSTGKEESEVGEYFEQKIAEPKSEVEYPRVESEVTDFSENKMEKEKTPKKEPIQRKTVWSDQELVDAIREGGGKRELALAYIYKNWKKGAVSLIKNYGIALEAIDDIMSRAMETLDRMIRTGAFRGESRLQTYFYGIARNITLKITYEKIKKEGRMTLVEKFSSDIEMLEEYDFEKDKLLQRLNHAMGQLEGDCATLLSCQMKGMSIKEIAAEMNLKESTLRQRMQACRQKLRKLIEESGEPE